MKKYVFLYVILLSSSLLLLCAMNGCGENPSSSGGTVNSTSTKYLLDGNNVSTSGIKAPSILSIRSDDKTKISIGPSLHVKVKVMDYKGIPIQNAMVVVEDQCATTDANGEHTFANVSSGKVAVSAAADKHMSMTIVTDASNVTFSLMKQYDYFVAEDCTTGTVTIEVRDADGNPVDNAAIWVISVKGSDGWVSGRMQYTDVNGTTEALSRLSGTLLVTAWKDGVGSAHSVNLTLPAGANLFVPLQFTHSEGSVEGSVTTPTGSGTLSSACINTIPWLWWEGVGYSTVEGTDYTIVAPKTAAGEKYYLAVEAIDGSIPWPDTASDHKFLAGGFSLASGETKTIPTITMLGCPNLLSPEANVLASLLPVVSWEAPAWTPAIYITFIQKYRSDGLWYGISEGDAVPYPNFDIPVGWTTSPTLENDQMYNISCMAIEMSGTIDLSNVDFSSLAGSYTGASAYTRMVTTEP